MRNQVHMRLIKMKNTRRKNIHNLFIMFNKKQYRYKNNIIIT